MYDQPIKNQKSSNNQSLYNLQPTYNQEKTKSLTWFIVKIILLTVIFIPIILFCFMMSGLIMMAGDTDLGFFLDFILAIAFFGAQTIPVATYIYAILDTWRRYKPRPYSKAWNIYDKIMKTILILVAIGIVLFVVIITIKT